MSEYTPVKISLPNGLDEVGLYYSTERLPNESLADYRERLLSEARNPIEATQESLVKNIHRTVGARDVALFTVDLALGGDGEPVASDPYVEVTASHIRFYENYDAGDDPILSINLFDSGAKFIDDLDFSSASEFFNVSADANTVEYAYKQSRNLRIGNTRRLRYNHRLAYSRMNSLPDRYVSNLRFTNPVAFASLAPGMPLEETGEYYVDTVNGVIFSYDTALGAVSYEYNVFPFNLVWSPVRVYPYNDPDVDYIHKDLLLDTDGVERNLLLNATGARIANTVLLTHPLGWGN